VNANVSLRPDPRLFDDSALAEGIACRVLAGLDKGFRRAEEMLKPATLPAAIDLPKLSALEKSAGAVASVQAHSNQRHVRIGHRIMSVSSSRRAFSAATVSRVATTDPRTPS
jgi:hypothetical protein